MGEPVPETFHYVLALGSNRRHVRHGPPARVITATIAALQESGCDIKCIAKTIHTAPIGPSIRRYANSAILVATDKQPQQLLSLCKTIERQFGPRTGKRWSQRTLDIDIILWSKGPFASPTLIIPHPLFRVRDFVLKPLESIVPNWRDPLTGLTIRQLLAQLQKKSAKVVDRRPNPD